VGTARLVQQLSLVAPQLVIPAPPGAQLGTTTLASPASPPLDELPLDEPEDDPLDDPEPSPVVASAPLLDPEPLPPSGLTPPSVPARSRKPNTSAHATQKAATIASNSNSNRAEPPRMRPWRSWMHSLRPRTPSPDAEIEVVGTFRFPRTDVSWYEALLLKLPPRNTR